MASVALKSIGKSFGGVPVLSGIDLEVADGEFLTLVGASGAESRRSFASSPARAAVAGSVLIDGAQRRPPAPHERRVAMVFQSYALYPHMRVLRNIALPLVMSRLKLYERLPLCACVAAPARSHCGDRSRSASRRSAAADRRAARGARRSSRADSGSASRSAARWCGEPRRS
jgi:multiple sugar transport system ATP-binding protein